MFIIDWREAASQVRVKTEEKVFPNVKTEVRELDGSMRNFTISLHFLRLCRKIPLTKLAVVKYTIIAFAWNNEPHTGAARNDVHETKKPFIIRSV